MYCVRDFVLADNNIMSIIWQLCVAVFRKSRTDSESGSIPSSSVTSQVMLLPASSAECDLHTYEW